MAETMDMPADALDDVSTESEADTGGGGFLDFITDTGNVISGVGAVVDKTKAVVTKIGGTPVVQPVSNIQGEAASQDDIPVTAKPNTSVFQKYASKLGVPVAVVIGLTVVAGLFLWKIIKKAV